VCVCEGRVEHVESRGTGLKGVCGKERERARERESARAHEREREGGCVFVCE